jgi:NAD(P)-dependent dehydrogenase (short-subunit alcohol dehydrogenase family)
MAEGGEPRFEGSVALVTGAASGIGRATVERLMSEGASVMATDRDEEALQQLVESFPEPPAVFPVDIREEEDHKAAIAETLRRFGRLDVAVANAGVGLAQPILDGDARSWREVIEVCLVGTYLTIRNAGRVMTDGGAIVVTASVNAIQPARYMSAYCAAKAGVAMLAQVAAMELGERSIRVNAVGPGLIRTAGTEPMWGMPHVVEEFSDNTALGRHGEPSEVAALIAFLASFDASYISGGLYLVDGGAHTGRYPDVFGLSQGIRPDHVDGTM